MTPIVFGFNYLKFFVVVVVVFPLASAQIEQNIKSLSLTTDCKLPIMVLAQNIHTQTQPKFKDKKKRPHRNNTGHATRVKRNNNPTASYRYILIKPYENYLRL